jgi:hypothetical protein
MPVTAFLSVAACRELDLLGNAKSFKLLMRSCTGDVSARTCAGRMGDDIHVYVLTLGAIIFDDVRGVIQREVHDSWIILIDLND